MSVQCGDRIEMSQRERDRLKVLHGVKEGEYTQPKPAQLLGLTSSRSIASLAPVARLGRGIFISRKC
jgi:hypothetical protein